MQFGLTKLPRIDPSDASLFLRQASDLVTQEIQNAGLNMSSWMVHNSVFRNCVAVTGRMDDAPTLKKIINETEAKFITVQVIYELSRENI